MNLNLIPTPTLEAEQFSVPPFQGQQQPMQQPMPEQPMPEQPQGLLGRIGAGIKRSVQDPNFMDRLTIGLGGMTMNPNEAFMSLAQNRINQRQKLGLINEQKNRTIEALKRLNTPQAMRALQFLDAGGSISDALGMGFANQKANIKIVDGKVIDFKDPSNPTILYEGSKGSNIKIVDGKVIDFTDLNNPTILYEGNKGSNIKIVDGKVIDFTDLNNPKVVYEGDKDSNIKIVDGKVIDFKDPSNPTILYEGDKDSNIKIVDNKVIDFTDLNNPKVVYEGDTTTAREAKIQDYMTTYNISREEAVSFMSNRFRQEVDTFGNLRIIDTLTNKEVSSTKPKIDEVDKTVESTIDQTGYDFPALFTGESLIGSVAQPVSGIFDIDSPYLEKRKKAENYLDITNQQTMAALKKSTRPLAREYEEISNILLKGGVTKTSRNAASQAQEVIDLLTKQLDLETKSATYDSTGQALGQSKEAIDELNNVIQRYKNILSGLKPKPRRSLTEIMEAR